MNTIALTELFVCPFFSAFLFFGVFAVSGLGGHFFWKEWKTKKSRQNNQKKKHHHKMQTRKPLSLVYKKRKQTTQTQHNATSLFRLQTDNAGNKKARTKTWNIKDKKLHLTNLSSKSTRIAGKTHVFHRLKAKQDTRPKTKQGNYQKQNQHFNRKTETYTMQTKTKTTADKKNQPKMKATWVWKRGCWESLFQ